MALIGALQRVAVLADHPRRSLRVHNVDEDATVSGFVMLLLLLLLMMMMMAGFPPCRPMLSEGTKEEGGHLFCCAIANEPATPGEMSTKRRQWWPWPHV